MIDPKLYASAVLLAEQWWQQFFNGSPSPLSEALKPVSKLTPELSELHKLVTSNGDYGAVKKQRIEANESLARFES